MGQDQPLDFQLELTALDVHFGAAVNFVTLKSITAL
jgi:hypothetical protein